jgi:hypothetical protein
LRTPSTGLWSSSFSEKPTCLLLMLMNGEGEEGLVHVCFIIEMPVIQLNKSMRSYRSPTQLSSALCQQRHLLYWLAECLSRLIKRMGQCMCRSYCKGRYTYQCRLDISII